MNDHPAENFPGLGYRLFIFKFSARFPDPFVQPDKHVHKTRSVMFLQVIRERFLEGFHTPHEGILARVSGYGMRRGHYLFCGVRNFRGFEFLQRESLSILENLLDSSVTESGAPDAPD